MRRTDGANGCERGRVVEQHAAAAINLQVDKTWHQHAPIECDVLGMGRHGIARNDAGDVAELNEQDRIVMPVIAIKDAGAGKGEKVAHTVSVTLRSIGGSSGLRPRWRASASTKP
ncbi:hypothetical protein D3C86_1979980 [compost metagenome]